MEKEAAIRTLWNFHLMHHRPEPSDCILVLGSHDLRVAQHAAELFRQGLAGRIIFSGGLGRLTEGMWHRPEAEVFAQAAMDMGIPAEKIWQENRSTNTGENLAFTKKLLEEKGADYRTFIVVQKPYMERRAYATFKKYFPDKVCLISSPPLSFEDYCIADDPEINPERVVHLIVGDLQRLWIYARKGFQVPQEIPPEVMKAYESLVSLGYTDHLVEE
jgi:uncharacterized SAM-binding protein YcdF (DUF218 family)